jgi:hypothetical protein
MLVIFTDSICENQLNLIHQCSGLSKPDVPELKLNFLLNVIV